MRRLWVVFLLAIADGCPCSDSSQRHGNVTVNGLRRAPDTVIAKFVEFLTSPSRVGKIARWHQRVCPKTTGLAPKLAAYVAWRVRDIATQIGVPLDSGTNTNIHIMFLDQPQALLVSPISF